MKLLRVGDRRIVLGRTEHGYVAFDDRCTHKAGSQFDVRSGEVKAGPVEQPISTYRVEASGGDVRLIL